MVQTEYRSGKGRELGMFRHRVKAIICGCGQGHRLPWDGELAIIIRSGKGKTCGKKNRGLKTEASPLGGRGIEPGKLCSKLLTLDPTPEHRPGPAQGEKASWATAMLLPSCQTPASLFGDPAPPHQSTNDKHHTLYYYTEPSGSYGEQPPARV